MGSRDSIPHAFPTRLAAMSDLLTESASELARKVRDGELSARDLVEVHIGRAQAVNPAINAIVADRYEEARDEADKADARLHEIGKDAVPAFHGVPCTIKECFAFAGMPNTSGLVARTGHQVSDDATTVARVRAAGAIPLGVTNTSELCMWLESNNRVYGRTNNPYDPSRIVGGSSGGEGAIVASGASPFGLGSDVAGSIRFPAYFNGIFGHKPSGGLVPSTGQFPTVKEPAGRFLTTGPLCRRAEDLLPLLELLAGPDGSDPACEPMEIGDPASVDLAKLRVLDVAGNGRTRVSGDLQAAQSKVAEHLRTLGAAVEKRSFSGLRHSFDIWSSTFGSAQGTDSFKRDMQRSAPELAWHLLLWAIGRSPHTVPALLLGLVENVGTWTPKRTKRFVDAGRELRQEMIEAIGKDGIMLYPSYPTTAPRHNQPINLRFDYVFMGILNILEFPVTQVPLGLDGEGLPLGVQVASIPGNDHVTIAVALELERAFGGWVPPWKTRQG